MDKGRTRQFRDLTLAEWSAGDILVIACDSLGAIGEKELDQVRASYRALGSYTARVPLMEVLAAGAEPLVVVNTLCMEMDPGGISVIAGINDELELAGLAGQVAVTGSTEENMLTRQSGVGVTVIGKAAKSELRLGRSQAGDLVVCLGVPLVGEEVLQSAKQANPALVKDLLRLPWIRELLPVGSKGILYEAGELARWSGHNLVLCRDCSVDLSKSAGPATCLLAAMAEEYFLRLEQIADIPVTPVAYLV